jgi:hypothetical protein
MVLGLQVIDIRIRRSRRSWAAGYAHQRCRRRCVGNFAYVAVATGLQIIDISDPVIPAIVGSVDTPANAPRCRCAGKLCLCGGWQLRSPDNRYYGSGDPEIVGSVDTPSNALRRCRAREICLRGGWSFRSPGDRHFDPTIPTIVGSVGTPQSRERSRRCRAGRLCYGADERRSPLFDTGPSSPRSSATFARGFACRRGKMTLRKVR